MSFPFQGSQTGNLVQYKVRIAPQTVEDVPAVSGFSDFRVWGAPLTVSPGNIPAQRLNSTRAPLPALIGKTAFNPFGPMHCGDFDPGNPGQNNWIANGFGKYDLSNPDPAVYRRIYSNLGATTAAPYNTLLVDDDADFRMRFHSIVCSGFHISAQPNGNASFIVDLQPPNGFDWHGAVSQTAGSGSTLPIFSGTWTGSITLGFNGEGQWVADATDRDIYIKIITKVGDVVTIKSKYSSAATYDGNAVSYTLGTLPGASLRNQVNQRFGRVADHVRAYWPAGATLVVDDEFKVLKRAAAWTPSYATERSIPSPNITFFVGGEQIKTSGGWALDAVADGLQHTDDVYGLQSGSTLRSGQWIATLKPTRTIKDLTLQRALHSRQKVDAVLDFELDTVIGATTYPYRAIAVLSNCDVSGTSFVVDPGARNNNETVTLTAAEPTNAVVYDGITFPLDSFSFLIDNAIASL